MQWNCCSWFVWSTNQNTWFLLSVCVILYFVYCLCLLITSHVFIRRFLITGIATELFYTTISSCSPVRNMNSSSCNRPFLSFTLPRYNNESWGILTFVMYSCNESAKKIRQRTRWRLFRWITSPPSLYNCMHTRSLSNFMLPIYERV